MAENNADQEFLGFSPKTLIFFDKNWYVDRDLFLNIERLRSVLESDNEID